MHGRAIKGVCLWLAHIVGLACIGFICIDGLNMHISSLFLGSGIV